jgi:hypothetical protein
VKNVLLLTSTVRPKSGQPQLVLTDPKLRLEEYRNALLFYSTQLERGFIDRIVYAGNSGFDLTPLQRDFPSPSIEWISFYDLDYEPTYHRGYGEFRLVERAHEESRELGSLGPRDRIWKVTGRYVVRNLRRVVAMAPREFDFYCDQRGAWVEMSLLAWSRVGYQRHVAGLWRHFATGKVPELVLAERLHALGADRQIVTSMRWPPYITGRRGSDGTPFVGRFTPLKFLLAASVKLAQSPFRA